MDPDDMDFNPDDVFEAFKAVKNRKAKVTKTVKATEEEVMEFMALKGFEAAAKKAMGVHASKKNLFWSKIELRTGYVNNKMRYNEKDNTIELIEFESTKPADGFPD